MTPSRLRKLFVRGFISVCIVGVVGYYLIHQLEASMSKGEVRTELGRTITKRLLDSAAVGLDRFKAIHQHYPQCVGKYFLDSIKTLVQVDEVYVYADSFGEGGQPIQVKKQAGKLDYLNCPHTYFGAGRPELTIIYRPLSMDSYKLYGVGENGQDEGGKGDDILF